MDSQVTKTNAMREKVLTLQHQIAQMPQCELPTNHYFADGLYAREMHMVKDTVIVGKIHKREHLFILTKGRLAVTTDDGVKELEAPFIMVGKPGTKRAGVALTDCVCVNVHRTDKKNLRKIEKELIESEKFSMFDSANKLKALQ